MLLWWWMDVCMYIRKQSKGWAAAAAFTVDERARGQPKVDKRLRCLPACAPRHTVVIKTEVRLPYFAAPAAMGTAAVCNEKNATNKRKPFALLFMPSCWFAPLNTHFPLPNRCGEKVRAVSSAMCRVEWWVCSSTCSDGDGCKGVLLFHLPFAMPFLARARARKCWPVLALASSVCVCVAAVPSLGLPWKFSHRLFVQDYGRCDAVWDGHDREDSAERPTAFGAKRLSGRVTVGPGQGGGEWIVVLCVGGHTKQTCRLGRPNSRPGDGRSKSVTSH